MGYPVREVRFSQAEAKARLGFDPAKPLLLVLGGSQGSLELNERLPPLLKPLGLPVLHQVGERWLERYRHLEGETYRIAGFLDAPLAMSAADLLLARAGAGTLAEAAFHRLPALLFPLSPRLDGGAQRANALAYQKAGAARLGDYSRLAQQVEELLHNPELPGGHGPPLSRGGGGSPGGLAGGVSMKRVHIMGIEGVGMSALARLLLAEGVAVTGCDLAPGKRAKALGVPVHAGHDPGHLQEEDTLVVPTPVPLDHPEVVAAKERGLRVLRRMELLAQLLAQGPSLGVTGTHGKTTTTGMLASILLEAGLDPWVLLGGSFPSFPGTPATERGPAWPRWTSPTPSFGR